MCEAEPVGGELVCEVEQLGEGRVFSLLGSPASPTVFMCEVEPAGEGARV